MNAGLDDYSAEVSTICGNWFSVRAAALAIANDVFGEVNVFATSGRLENLEHQPYEHYIVTTDNIITSDCKTETVLITPEIVQIANITRRCVEADEQPVRTEFLILADDSNLPSPMLWQIEHITDVVASSGIFTIRLAEKSAAPNLRERARGPAFRISKDEIARFVQTTSVPPGTILLFDGAELNARNTDETILIARTCRRLNAPLVTCTSPLSHFATLLREYGVTVWPARTLPENVRDGEWVVVEFAGKRSMLDMAATVRDPTRV